MVCNIGSLEHFQSMEAALRETCRVLRPRGRAVILLPNAFSLVDVLRVWRTGDVNDDGQPLQRTATLCWWRRLLTEGGLDVQGVLGHYRERPRTLADAWWYVLHPSKLARVLLAPVMPLTWASSFVFVCRKGDERTAASMTDAE